MTYKALRQINGLTQKQVASKVGINQSNVSLFENNKLEHAGLREFYGTLDRSASEDRSANIILLGVVFITLSIVLQLALQGGF